MLTVICHLSYLLSHLVVVLTNLLGQDLGGFDETEAASPVLGPGPSSGPGPGPGPSPSPSPGPGPCPGRALTPRALASAERVMLMWPHADI